MLGSSMDDPKTLGLLQLASSLSSGQKFVPALSQGLLGRAQIMGDAKRQEALDQYRQLQMQQLAMQHQQAQKAVQQQDTDRALMQKAMTPVQAIEANAASGITGPRPQALGAVGQMPGFNLAQFMQSGGSLESGLAMQQALAKQQAKIKDYKEVRMPDGSVQIVGFDEYGKPVDTGRTPFKAEEVRDFGGFVGGIDPITGKARKIGNKTMAPGEVASNALGWANAGIARDRLKLDQESAGGVTYQTDGTGQIVALPKRPNMAGPVTAMPVQGQGSQGKKDANEALAIIGEAKKYLNDATGSGLGAATDATLGFFGKATDGAKATAQLQALSGALVAKMPRMSGPQSDKDVMLYKQMAADIGNPWTPNEQRRAALSVVEGLQRKYAGLEPMSGQASPGGLKFLGFEGQ